MHQEIDDFRAKEVRDANDIPDENLRLIYQAWVEAAASNTLPAASSFDPINHLDTATRWTILDAVKGAKDFVLRFQGTEVVRMTGTEGTGQRLTSLAEEIGPKLLARVIDTCSWALRRGRPILVGPAKSAVQGKSWVISTSLTLPLSRSGNELDRALIVANYQTELAS